MKFSIWERDLQVWTERWYLASLGFGKNCRKIGVNTSRPDSIKWWHHWCHHFMLHFVFICSNQNAVFVGGTSHHHEYLLKTLLWHHHRWNYFHSPRQFQVAHSNSKACQVPSKCRTKSKSIYILINLNHALFGCVVCVIVGDSRH